MAPVYLVDPGKNTAAGYDGAQIAKFADEHPRRRLCSTSEKSPRAPI